MTQTFCHKLIESAARRADKAAITLIKPDNTETVTFNELLAKARSLAFRLSREGIEKGDRVALLGENHPHWALAYYGILLRGAVAVPLDPAASLEALTAFLKGSAAKLAFISPASLNKFRSACERLGQQIPAVLLHPTQPPNDSPNGFAHFEDWASAPIPPEFSAAPPPAKPEDVAVLMYTSGTTGFPKAVPLTHGNIYAECTGVQAALHVDEREVVLGLLPLFHVYSQIVTLWLAPLIGARVVYITELNSAEIARGLKAGAVTALIGVPRVWYLFHKKIFDGVRQQSNFVQWLFKALLRINGWLRDWFGLNAGRVFFKRVHAGFGGKLRLAVSAGASFDARVAMDFHRLGFTLLQGYGLTETCGAATLTRFEDNKIGSVGTPLDGVEVRIAEPNAEGISEVLIRGPIVTPGYFQNPEANRETFTADGWYRTGDLGRLDEQGHLFIVGRSKDVIKLPSGKNVFPEDVEAHYARSPLVSEVCVLGVRDEASGFARAEKLLAVIVPDFDYLKAHHIANAREAIRFEMDNLGRELPEYQRVRDYRLRTEPLPRTTTRKVQRFEVQRQLEAAGTATKATRDTNRFVLTAAERALLDSVAGRAVTAALKEHISETAELHPQMNLELDLGLDSLARAESLVKIEQALGVEFEDTQAAGALTIGELIALGGGRGRLAAESSPTELDWRELLAQAPRGRADGAPLLKPKTFLVWAVFVLLQLIYALARLLFQLEVENKEALKSLKRPFLICPNHQSYLDPLLICSTYPRDLLQHIFHVGASEYFVNPLMKWLARLLNIVPVDADVHLLRALQAGAAGLQAGKVLNIYPEGQRSFDGRLHEFKDGAAILATELKLPIVPVAIDGTYRVWPRQARRLHLAKVKIRFGQPINVLTDVLLELPGEARYRAVTALMKLRTQELLNAMRQGRTTSTEQ
jgi:long-chain acyl-CoA synthetase